MESVITAFMGQGTAGNEERPQKMNTKLKGRGKNQECKTIQQPCTISHDFQNEWHRNQTTALKLQNVLLEAPGNSGQNKVGNDGLIPRHSLSCQQGQKHSNSFLSPLEPPVRGILDIAMKLKALNEKAGNCTPGEEANTQSEQKA